MRAKYISESIFKGPSEEEISSLKDKIFNSIKQNNDYQIIKSDKENNIIVLDSSYSFEDNETGFDFFNNMIVTIDLNEFEYYINMNITSDELPGFSFKDSQTYDLSNIITKDYEIDFEFLEETLQEGVYMGLIMNDQFQNKLNNYLEEDDEI